MRSPLRTHSHDSRDQATEKTNMNMRTVRHGGADCAIEAHRPLKVFGANQAADGAALSITIGLAIAGKALWLLAPKSHGVCQKSADPIARGLGFPPLRWTHVRADRSELSREEQRLRYENARQRELREREWMRRLRL